MNQHKIITMKKNLILTLVLFLFVQLCFSQSKSTKETVALKPLYEVFTSSTCGPCASQNPYVDAVLHDNPGAYSLIKYQMNWPGTGDIYYTAQGGDRRDYYSVTGVPNMFINGEFNEMYEFSQSDFDNFTGLTTQISLDIEASISLDNLIDITVNLNSLGDYESGLSLHTVVVEKVTTENVGSNGEEEFSHVMMQMFPNGDGETLGELSNGSTHNVSYSYDMNQTNMEQANDLALIVFVQDNSDKSIVQSEMVDVSSDLEDYMVTFEVINSLGAAVEDAQIVMDDYGVRHTDEFGIASYDNVLPGTYNYSITASGVYPVDGTITVDAEDVTEEVTMDVPEYCFYEDFEFELPEDWTVIATSPDFLYWADGHIVFFSQSTGVNPMVLVSPEFDLSEASFLEFDAGDVSGNPTLHFGTLSSPDDLDSFNEMFSCQPNLEFETYTVDFSDYSGDHQYFAFKFEGNQMDWFSVDNVTITCEETTVDYYNVVYNITDQDGTPLEDVIVNFDGSNYFSSDNGVVEIVNVEAGTYDYSVVKSGYLLYENSVTVTENTEIDIELIIDDVYGNNHTNISVYPNPVAKYVNIRNAKGYRLQCWDAKGIVVLQMDIQSDLELIPVSELANGVYTIQLSNGNEMIRERVIKIQ
jgi:hypothetical protein